MKLLTITSDSFIGCRQNWLPFNDAIIYHYNHSSSVEIHSFEDALKPGVWKQYFQPFACVIVNNDSNEIILSRDHLGVEPLYYCCYQGKTLIVAQTIPEIIKQLPSVPSLRPKQINMLFSEHKVYSDETLYQGIYRVDPGHLIHFKANGSITKRAFWQLDSHGPMLHYKDEQDYLDHFSMLMDEAIINATENQTNIAAEFSAGLDSSAVYCAATRMNLNPTLYMHIAPSETKSHLMYNDSYEKAFINHYPLVNIQHIGAETFDPIQTFNEYASWFAGPAPYLFPMFSNPVHRAVEAGGHPILLSGFGGDQCISHQVPTNFFMPELIHGGQYKQAWFELKKTQGAKKILLYASYMHPIAYALSMNIKKMKRYASNAIQAQANRKPTSIHPYQQIYYRTVREAECSLLQGTNSHEVRMRIEYSGVVSKKMGFEYRYPLLYPKLLEFMLSVPMIEKRRDGRGRYLIRRYLAQCLQSNIFNTYSKKDGLGIVPSSFEKFQKKFEQGCYLQEFKNLPFPHLIQNRSPGIHLRNHIKGFMLKAVQKLND